MGQLEQEIDAIFSKWQQGLCPGGQVAVRKNGKVIYKGNFGYANIEYRIPVKDETVFHVASVSKQLTVMCVLLLQEDGKLNIDDDVRKYVSEYINFKEPVTIRQMMNNVSGIRDQWELLGLSGVRIEDTITQKDALSIISKQKRLNFEPQSQFLYSNSNFTLLAEIVERLTGKTLNEFASERIFKPLRMNRTFFKDNYWMVIPEKASSYYDDSMGNIVYSVLNYGTYGATSLNTTATDFLKWMENFKSPRICSEETLTIMCETRLLTDGTDNNYAGGLFVGEYKGRRYLEHGGADAAYRSAMMRFPDDDVDIVIFSNTQNMLMKDAAFAVANVVFGIEESEAGTQQVEAYRKDCNIEEVAGYYYPVSESLFMTFDITIRDGIAYLKNPYGDAPLTHVSGNHFKIDQFNFDLYLGENSVLQTSDNRIISLKKVKPFKPKETCIYIGKYYSGELDTFYEVIEKDGMLYMSHFRHGEELLYQVDENKFVTNVPFTFTVDFLKEGAAVNGFVFNGGRVKGLQLTKIDE
ncbi:serine hydrolase [Evansella sp. AB-P1]|uniref:serine hydrolase domain-containing protein n=1 Tax=Evansella sp. AB-P1 TaxID=3037653 RepID=UPI00241F59C3|nr:serine hydrolase domain-containing protein [Evansella sp. AB-P1]MDG5788572.1 serine hydrolase [Evansella sp. AB-P1]